MKKQYIAIAAAAILALAGILLLVRYAQNAEDRAFEATEMVEVLRATDTIPPRTPVNELGGRVERVEIPRSAVIPGALDTLDGLSGQITNVTILPGDQLAEGRFGAPDEVTTRPDLPEGMQELALPSSAVRLVDGAVRAGDRVGVFVTYSSGNVVANPINELLILSVNDRGGESPHITVAVDTEQALILTHAQTFGNIWFTRQNDDTDTGGGSAVRQRDVVGDEQGGN